MKLLHGSIATDRHGESSMHKIVVAGAGFAGLMTLKTLRQQGYKGPMVLLAPKPELFYYPATIWVPAGLYQERDLTFSLERFLHRHDVEYVAGCVTGLEATSHRLYTTVGEMAYERLVIATAGNTARKVHGLEHVCIPCDGYPAVLSLQRRLAALQEGTLAFGFSGNPHEPTALRSEPLFEFLFGTDTLLRRQKRRDRFHLVFFTPCMEADERWGSKGPLQRELAQRGIECHVGRGLHGFGAAGIQFADGEIPSDFTVFIPELVGPSWAKQSDLPLSEDGFIRADTGCRVLGFEGKVYVAGDAGHFPTPAWVPRHGHTANHHATTLVRNLLGDMRGEPTQHTFRQELIYIVDTLEGGLLVFRNHRHSFAWRSPLLHWAKRLFIRTYLREYRTT